MKNNRSSITIVAENTCLMNDILSQHWVSFWIKYYWKNYLFDCAQILSWLEHNFKTLDLNPKKIDWIIISHDHYDHCHALPELSEKYRDKKIYVPKDFKSFKSWNIIKIDDALELEKWFFLTWSMDWWDIKEQSILIDFNDEWVMIISWCSHPGIIKIIDKAIEITWNKKIMWVIGWLHLVESDDEEIQKTIDYLKDTDIWFVIPGHCTWINAVNMMKEQLPDKIKTSLMWSIGAWNKIDFVPELKFHIDEW